MFVDAPESDAERGKVITEMVNTQYEMIRESTGEDNPFVRMTFYDEISSLLAAGHIQPPTATNMLWQDGATTNPTTTSWLGTTRIT